jgi:predicted transcriptional regulator of viral defense system
MEQNNQIFVKSDSRNGRSKLARLVGNGSLERVERGIYRRTQADVSEYESLLVAGLLVPKGVICLLSALRFHDLTTQNPYEIWMAIEPSAHRPKPQSVSLRLVHFSGESLTEGIETHEITGEKLRVYNPAKTIADCFKFRHKIGLDTALEALREARRKKLFTMEELWHYTKICRVTNVMRPYLEAL